METVSTVEGEGQALPLLLNTPCKFLQPNSLAFDTHHITDTGNSHLVGSLESSIWVFACCSLPHTPNICKEVEDSVVMAG